MANFITVGDVKALSSRQPEIKLMDEVLRTARLQYEPVLESFAADRVCADLLRTLTHSVLRCALSKPCGKEFNPHVKAGIMDKENSKQIQDAWRSLC